MSVSNVLPFPLGSTSTNASYASLLGSEYRVMSTSGPKTFKLVKAAAQIASPARKCVISALDSSALPTWNVNTTTTANSPVGLVISTDYSSTIASGAYFLAQWQGPAEVISAAAVAASALVGTSTTAGKADDASVTGASFGYALEAAGGADENMAIMMR